jgi:bifunctional non-homologous end joining protein LigD
VADRLERYRAKRTFDETPEPSGAGKVEDGSGLGLRFVVQKHAARRLHYDVRLEADGVLISWAVPKGPSYNPKTKRLAVHVEDHPLDYRTFEGVIPNAQYGAGSVIVWDEGTYRNLTERDGKEVAVVEAVRRGHVSVWLEGAKLKGGWSLTRTGGSSGDKEQWLMIKRADETADPDLDITASAPDSAVTGRSLDDVSRDRDATWTREQATWTPPMLAQLVKPDHHARRPGEWRYERKLDGLRCVAVRNGDQVDLWSRNHLSFSGRFPELVDALRALPASNFTLDGEIVAFEGAKTSFAGLQRGDAEARVVLGAFDLLQLLGQDTTGLPLGDRQRLLAQVIDGAPAAIFPVESFEGDPLELLRRACADGWEGLIAKRVGSTYRSGRSDDWQKLKCTASQELVVAGWTEPKGSRVGFGALLVGYYDGDDLRYAGKVGTGFDHEQLVDMHRQLVAMERKTSPFADVVKERGAHWATPQLVAVVSFTEWTTDGRLRHPSFLGLRPDKTAHEVRRETPA